MGRIVPHISNDDESTSFWVVGVVLVLSLVIGSCIRTENKKEIDSVRYGEYAKYAQACPPFRRVIEKKMVDHKITVAESEEIDTWILNYNKALLFGLPYPEVK